MTEALQKWMAQGYGPYRIFLKRHDGTTVEIGGHACYTRADVNEYMEMLGDQGSFTENGLTPDGKENL